MSTDRHIIWGMRNLCFSEKYECIDDIHPNDQKINRAKLYQLTRLMHQKL